MMLIDISRPIHAAMAMYPNNSGVSLTQVQKAEHGTSALSTITLGSHTGTHIDSLSHIQDGAWGSEAYALEQLIGPCDVVIIADDVSAIHAADIPPTTAPRVLLKTWNSSVDIDTFDSDFVALAEDAAQELVRRGVTLVGIDALSIKKRGIKDRVHEIFLKKRICIVEGLYFANVSAGTYELLCLPLAIAGIDGVPARAILRV